MKPPYFPDPAKPKEASPYREAQAPSSAPGSAPAALVSRPEPPPEVAPAKRTKAKPNAEKPKTALTPGEAQALLAVDRGRGAHTVRARLFVVPLTYVLWRYGSSFSGVRPLVYPLFILSVVLVVLEIRRIWQRTAL